MGAAEFLAAIWDARQRSWVSPLQPARTAWLREHGLPADDMYRAEFYLLDAPFARIFCYHNDADGRRHWNDRHDPRREHDHDLCDIAVEPPRDVLLSELPPPGLCQVP